MFQISQNVSLFEVHHATILSLLWELNLLNQQIPPVIAEAEYFVFYN